MPLIGQFDPHLAEATVSALAGQPAPDGYIAVRVSFGRRMIYTQGVGPYPRRTFPARRWWGIYPYARAKAAASEYLSRLGIIATDLLPTTVRPSDTSSWVVVGRLHGNGGSDA
jgi:hypothetical protein